MANRAKERKESQGLPEGIEAQAVAPTRRIVLETDGSRVNVVEANVGGLIEFKAILLTVIQAIDAGVIK